MEMCLKKNFETIAFLRAVRTCSGDVIFRTREGDVLNLKSQLCMYLFAAASGNARLMASGAVTCANEADFEKLTCFLQTEPQEQEGESDVSV